MYTVNHLENFALHLEHDEGYEEDDLISPEVIEAIGRKKIVIGGDRVLDDCSYIWVDLDYMGQLSPGQQKLYEILVAVQKASLYFMTNVEKLAEAQGLKNPSACAERLCNLQSLGAISGFKLT